MSKTLDNFGDKIAARKAEVDAEFAPKIRNHLLQLFRAAHAVDPELTGTSVGMGTAVATGCYTLVYDDGDELPYPAPYWNPKNNTPPKHPEAAAWLSELGAYSDRLCTGQDNSLPYINDITLDDLVTERVKKAKVWNRKST